MNEEPSGPIDKAAVQRLVRRVDGFARGLGLDGDTMRRIAEGVIADMPSRSDEERVMEARKRLLLAAG